MFLGLLNMTRAVLPGMMIHESRGIYHQRFVFPMPNRLAVEAGDDDIGIGVLADIRVDDSDAVHKALIM
jgi:hypothetical protein